MLKIRKHLLPDTSPSPWSFYAFPVGDWYSSTCFALNHYLGQPRMQPNAFADENFMHQGWAPLGLSSIRDFKRMETVLGK